MSFFNHFGEVVDLSVSIGVLDEDAAHRPCGEIEIVEIVDHRLHSEMVGSCLDDGQGVWVDVSVHVEHVVLVILKLPAVREREGEREREMFRQEKDVRWSKDSQSPLFERAACLETGKPL